MGSSPHTRGALTETTRIYPAPADHPRIRGEHAFAAHHRHPGGGSSPHTRGAPSAEPAATFRTRIIPAYAGSTSCGPDVHPSPDGSSPHTRGAREDHGGRRQMRRIIPAYAGSTSQCCPSQTSGVDHPRIRGEHDDEPAGAVEQPGSSPHTRGARPRRRRHAHRRRIIPAYAGSTDARSVQSPFDSGSSPHTRGAPCTSTRQSTVSRIIPAYAGSTLHEGAVRRQVQDHPRIRGEHLFKWISLSVKYGSSPHTRGARQPGGEVL